MSQNFLKCVSTHQKGPVVSEDQNLLFFPKWLFFYFNFGANFFKSNITFLRYGNFIEDVITNCEKLIFRKRPLKFVNLYKSIGILAIYRSIFT